MHQFSVTNKNAAQCFPLTFWMNPLNEINNSRELIPKNEFNFPTLLAFLLWVVVWKCGKVHSNHWYSHCLSFYIIVNQSYLTLSFSVSESSMFVSKRRFILKTCGTTLLLQALVPLLELAREYCGFDAIEVTHTHAHTHRFMFVEGDLLHTISNHSNAKW